jgi:hypothetical protein
MNDQQELHTIAIDSTFDLKLQQMMDRNTMDSFFVIIMVTKL